MHALRVFWRKIQAIVIKRKGNGLLLLFYQFQNIESRNLINLQYCKNNKV